MSYWYTFAFVFIAVQFHFIIGKPIKNENTTGCLLGNRYENDFFRLSMEMPENWHFIGNSELRPLMEKYPNSEMITNIFGFAEYALGTSTNNPNMIVLGFKRTNESNLCTHLMGSQDTVPMILANVHVEECREVVLNERSFGMQELKGIAPSSVTVYQIQYRFFTANGYILTFTLTYFNEKEKAILDNVMKCISFLN